MARSVSFVGGGDLRTWGGSRSAGPAPSKTASKTEPEYRNDDSKSPRSSGGRSSQIRMIRCVGVSDPSTLRHATLEARRPLACGKCEAVAGHRECLIRVQFSRVLGASFEEMACRDSVAWSYGWTGLETGPSRQSESFFWTPSLASSACYVWGRERLRR